MKLPRSQKEYQGCKFFPLEGNIIECTYHDDCTIEDFWIYRVLVEQPELIAELADTYDNDKTYNDILDYETGEADHEEFITSHSTYDAKTSAARFR